jgi:hypothetical protein
MVLLFLFFVGWYVVVKYNSIYFVLLIVVVSIISLLERIFDIDGERKTRQAVVVESIGLRC